MVLCVTLNPVVDTTLFVDAFESVYRTEAHEIRHLAGGKGNNTARALVGMGMEARVLVALGGVSGRHLVALLGVDGVETVVAAVSGETRIVVTVVDSHYEQRAFFAPSAPFTEGDAVSVRARFDAALDGVEAMCLCGSSPGPMADPLYPELLRRAAGRGIPTLLDTYGEALRLGLEAAPTIVKVNRSEAADLFQRRIDTVDDQKRALDDLRRSGARWAVLTIGREGALLASGSQYLLARPPEVASVNPIGSGDAMTAGLLAGWLRKQPPEECFRLGMAAAVANTQSWDACRLMMGDIEPLLDEIEIGPL
jgi:1-phosphofructokinase family hexose kinase